MRATGMKRSSFYHYFRDRSAVIIRLLEEIEGEAAQAAAAWLDEPAGDPAEAVRTAITGVAGVWDRHRHVLRAVQAGSFHDPRIEHQYRGVCSRALMQAVAAGLRRERRRGAPPSATPTRWPALSVSCARPCSPSGSAASPPTIRRRSAPRWPGSGSAFCTRAREAVGEAPAGRATGPLGAILRLRADRRAAPR